VYLKAEKEEITLKQGAIEMYFPLIRWKMFETYLEDVDEAVEPSVYRIVRMLETVPGVWGTSYCRWESTSDILYLHNSQLYRYYPQSGTRFHPNVLSRSVLTGPEKEDMAVCFPEHSSFHLGGEVYLKAEKEEITLKQGAIEMHFPLIRWKMFETYLEDVDEAVEQIRNNRYSSVIEHLGGNVYLTGVPFWAIILREP
jgi:hypothetical protein